MVTTEYIHKCLTRSRDTAALTAAIATTATGTTAGCCNNRSSGSRTVTPLTASAFSV